MRFPTPTTPAFRTPLTPPEGSLSLTWDFETPETAQAWAALMRDMLPCAVHTYWDRPGWAVRWSVETYTPKPPYSPGREPGVRVNLWCEPASAE